MVILIGLAVFKTLGETVQVSLFICGRQDDFVRPAGQQFDDRLVRQGETELVL